MKKAILFGVFLSMLILFINPNINAINSQVIKCSITNNNSKMNTFVNSKNFNLKEKLFRYYTFLIILYLIGFILYFSYSFITIIFSLAQSILSGNLVIGDFIFSLIMICEYLIISLLWPLIFIIFLTVLITYPAIFTEDYEKMLFVFIFLIILILGLPILIPAMIIILLIITIYVISRLPPFPSSNYNLNIRTV